MRKIHFNNNSILFLESRIIFKIEVDKDTQSEKSASTIENNDSESSIKNISKDITINTTKIINQESDLSIIEEDIRTHNLSPRYVKQASTATINVLPMPNKFLESKPRPIMIMGTENCKGGEIGKITLSDFDYTPKEEFVGKDEFTCLISDTVDEISVSITIIVEKI